MHQEEDFKKVLKKLLLEKQKQEFVETDAGSPFESKENTSVVTLKDHLKSKIHEQERDIPDNSKEIIADLKIKLERVRPTLKKLVDEVKRSQDYINQLEEEKKDLEDETTSLKKNHLKDLEHYQREKETIHQELIRLKDQIKSAKDEGASSKNIHYEEEIHALKKELENLHLTYQERQKEWEELRLQDSRHLQQLDSERQRLVERLADNLSQTQRQTDYIKETRDEISQYKQKIHQYQSELTIRDKEFEDLRHQLNKISREADELKGLFQAKESENSHLKEKIQELEKLELRRSVGLESQDELKLRIGEKDSLIKELKEELLRLQQEKKNLESEKEEGVHIEKKVNDFWNEKLNSLIQEHEAALKEQEIKFQHVQEQASEEKKRLENDFHELSQKYHTAFSKQEKDREEIENLSEVIQNFRIQYQEREDELRKAQQHLAKKIKETTLLRDLVERQKVQLMEFQNHLSQNKSELNRLQNQFNLQRQHEEKLHLMAKERVVNAEEQSKSWQQKFIELQTQHISLKHECSELVKVKRSYDLILQTINQFKMSLESIPFPKLELSETLTASDQTDIHE